MKILQIAQEGLPDFRADKLSRILSENGYQVDLLSLKGESSGWPWGETFSISNPTLKRKIVRRSLRYARPRAFDLLFDGFSEYADILKRGNYAAVQWKDLPGAVTAARIAHRQRALFVLDVHENYPYNVWSTRRDAGLNSRFYDLDAWFDYERDSVQLADLVLVTVDEMGQRLIGMHGADPKRLVTIHNTEPLDAWPFPLPQSRLANRYQNAFTILYVGSCSRHRGLDTIIDALPELHREMPEATLVIVGAGGGISEWQRRSQANGVASKVHFEGYRSKEEVIDYYSAADIAVIPHHKYGQTDNTAPHKLYQGFVMGIPQLVSSCHSLQRIADLSQALEVFAAGNPTDAAKHILKLRNEEARRELGLNARAAAESGPFSWGAAEGLLVRAYRSLLETAADLGTAPRGEPRR